MGTTLNIRRWADSDDVSALTEMLHRAYKPLADMGLRYLATHQDDEVTRDRILSGSCYVVEAIGRVVGTVTLYGPGSANGRTPWYERADVAKFGQMAVEPEYQHRGIASQLMEHVEGEALRLGAKELALDTSELAHHLIRYYTKRGYLFIEHTQWPGVNYRSVIMSKSLR